MQRRLMRIKFVMNEPTNQYNENLNNDRLLKKWALADSSNSMQVWWNVKQEWNDGFIWPEDYTCRTKEFIAIVFGQI